jgi:hypothetical protein
MATVSPLREAKEGEIIAPGHTFGSVTDKISDIVQNEHDCGLAGSPRWPLLS